MKLSETNQVGDDIILYSNRLTAPVKEIKKYILYAFFFFFLNNLLFLHATIISTLLCLHRERQAINTLDTYIVFASKNCIPGLTLMILF